MSVKWVKAYGNLKRESGVMVYVSCDRRKDKVRPVHCFKHPLVIFGIIYEH